MSHAAPSHSKVGIITDIPKDGGPKTTVDLVACAHCGYMWEYKPGSGRIRGFCMCCNGLTCGRRACRDKVCTNWRQKLDNIEAGRPEDYKPIIVSVPAIVPTR